MNNDCKETVHPVTILRSLTRATETAWFKEERKGDAIRQLDIAILILLILEAFEVESEDVW